MALIHKFLVWDYNEWAFTVVQGHNSYDLMPNMTSFINRKTFCHDLWKLLKLVSEVTDPAYTPSDLSTSFWYGAIQVWAKNNNRFELY